MHAPPGLHAENDAASQADRVAAETLIRTTVQSVGNGSAPHDLDELVRRNAGRVTREDLRAGRLGSTILGDIINSVEQAKGNTAINWSAATPQQIKAYAMAHGLDFGTFQRLAGGQQSAGDSRQSEKASAVYEGKLASVTSHNYSGTPFAAAGLSYGTFEALRAQGFGEMNIIHAAQDTRTNGFDVNNKKIAGAFATLDKDDGKRREERNELLGRFRGRLDGDEEFQRLKHARDAAPTAQERAKIDGQLKKRGGEISREVGYHGHVEAAPTVRARKAGKLIESETIKQRTEHTIDHSIAPGDPKKAQEIKSIVDTHLRNRNDATARKNYEVLKQTAASDPNKRKALAQLERQLGKDKKLIKSAERQNEGGAAALNSTNKGIASVDDELAALVAKPTQKAGTPSVVAKTVTNKKTDGEVAQKKAVAENRPTAKVTSPTMA
jgi:hypothetical protein